MRIGTKACRDYAVKQKTKQLSWSWISGVTKCVSTGLKAGPVSLIWSTRLASITPQQLATIGKKCSKTLYNKKIALLKEKLSAVKQGSSISIAVSQRTNATSREKATIKIFAHHATA